MATTATTIERGGWGLGWGWRWAGLGAGLAGAHLALHALAPSWWTTLGLACASFAAGAAFAAGWLGAAEHEGGGQ